MRDFIALTASQPSLERIRLKCLSGNFSVFVTGLKHHAFTNLAKIKLLMWRQLPRQFASRCFQTMVEYFSNDVLTLKLQNQFSTQIEWKWWKTTRAHFIDNLQELFGDMAPNFLVFNQQNQVGYWLTTLEQIRLGNVAHC